MWQNLTFWQQVGVIHLAVAAVLAVWAYGDSRGGWPLLVNEWRCERAKKKARRQSKGGGINGR